MNISLSPQTRPRRLIRFRQAPAFSLVEVLFAVTFLLMVGLGMSALNSAAARLITSAETKLSAYALNEQALSHLSILRKSQDTFSIAPCIVGETCYIFCDPETLTLGCTLQTTPRAVQLGRSRLQYVTEFKARLLTTGNTTLDLQSYLLLAKTSWGSGVNRSVTSGQVVDPR